MEVAQSPEKKDEKIKAKGSPSKGADKNKKKPKPKPKGLTVDEILNKIEQIEKDQEKETVTVTPVAAPVVVKTEVGKPSEIQGKLNKQKAESQAIQKELQSLQAKLDSLAEAKEVVDADIKAATEKNCKLESLCQGLQKQNQAILEDVRGRGEAEQCKRKELSESFSATINEITAKMETQAQERFAMAQVNDELRGEIEKLKSVILAREDAFMKKSKKKDAEISVVYEKVKKIEEMFGDEEKKFEEFRLQMEAQHAQEETLRTQLQLYSSKFEQFETTLARSNPVFAAYRNEMDRLGSRIKQLEHENMQFRRAILAAELKIVEYNEEIGKCNRKSRLLAAQNAELQQACKQLTAERGAKRSTKQDS